MATLADELQTRGHVITFYQVEDCAPQIRAVGLRCEIFGRQTIPRGSMPEFSVRTLRNFWVVSLRSRQHYRRPVEIACALKPKVGSD